MKAQKLILLKKIEDKIKERKNAKESLKLVKKQLISCKIIEKEYSKKSKNPDKYIIINYIESRILKQYLIERSCYHSSNLKGNNIQRFMAKGIIIFEEIKTYVL